MKEQENFFFFFSELFFKMLLKKAYKKVDLREIKITHNISYTGILNIIATDGHYSYDMYITEMEYHNKMIKVFEISRHSEFSTYSDTKIFKQDTFELVQ